MPIFKPNSLSTTFLPSGDFFQHPFWAHLPSHEDKSRFACVGCHSAVRLLASVQGRCCPLLVTCQWVCHMEVDPKQIHTENRQIGNDS